MTGLTHKQRLALVWHATPAAQRAVVAGQKSVLAFRRSMLHMLPLSALSQHEIHLRIQQALRADAKERLATRGFPSLLSMDGLPWGIAFGREADPTVVHVADVMRGITTPSNGATLSRADFARRFASALAFAAKLNALALPNEPTCKQEKSHE